MTPPSATSIILFLVIVAAIYLVTFWGSDHPGWGRRAAVRVEAQPEPSVPGTPQE